MGSIGRDRGRIRHQRNAVEHINTVSLCRRELRVQVAEELGGIDDACDLSVFRVDAVDEWTLPDVGPNLAVRLRGGWSVCVALAV